LRLQARLRGWFPCYRDFITEVIQTVLAAQFLNGALTPEPAAARLE
jgi:hypothetical protein